MPSRRASASGSMLVVPQSTVMSSVAPRPASDTDRFEFGPIALEDAVRDMDHRIEPGGAQKSRQQRRRGCAVDVVIAEDRNFLASHRRVRDARCGVLHSREGVGIRHQPLHGGIEERLDVVHLDAASGENARQQFRRRVALRDRERAGAAALIEPRPPRSATRRSARRRETGDSFAMSASMIYSRPGGEDW